MIVEYPFSPHAGDALLALAQLEMARGDRDPAIDHLQRFLLQRPNDPERVRAGIWLGRLLLAHSEGNPFFAEELLRGWIETGVIAQSGPMWELVTQDAPALPASFRSRRSWNHRRSRSRVGASRP